MITAASLQVKKETLESLGSQDKLENLETQVREETWDTQVNIVLPTSVCFFFFCFMFLKNGSAGYNFLYYIPACWLHYMTFHIKIFQILLISEEVLLYLMIYFFNNGCYTKL